jgi:hypothetical protein
MRYVVAVAGAAAILAGCGGDDEPKGKGIPADAVAALDERLDEIQRRFNDAVDHDNPGACEDIERDSVKNIQATVANLPSDVDPDIRQALEDGIQRLRELAQEGCSGVEPVETETTPEETVTEETTPTETETTPTETETTPPETTPPEQTTPQDPGNGDEGGTQAPQDGE